MTSKIQTGPIDRYAAATAASRLRGSTSAGSASATGSSTATAGDSLKLTGDALLLQDAHAAAASASGIDLQRVADVRQALRDGTYTINPQTIASKMLKTEWELTAT